MEKRAVEVSNFLDMLRSASTKDQKAVKNTLYNEWKVILSHLHKDGFSLSNLHKIVSPIRWIGIFTVEMLNLILWKNVVAYGRSMDPHGYHIAKKFYQHLVRRILLTCLVQFRKCEC